MSQFSGKYDLYDHISMEKMYPDPKNLNILTSNEKECFEIFKKKTGGKIYQWKLVSLSKRNIDYFVSKDDSLEKISQKRIKTKKDGTQEEVVEYIYKYHNKEYKTLTALNRYGYYYLSEIHFDDLLDIVPYYPYIISMAYCNNNQEHIIIGEKNYVEQCVDKSLGAGYDPNYLYHYRKELQRHYLEVVKEYYLEGAFGGAVN